MTGNTPVMSANGTDTNVSMTFLPKNNGAFNIVTANGINLTSNSGLSSIIYTSAGNGYTAFPNVTISPPTVTNGVQATANVSALYASAATIASGGTGYNVGDILTVVGGTTSGAVQFQVTGNSSGVITSVNRINNGQYTVLPTNPVATTGPTGSANNATLNLTYYAPVFSIINPGSGYVLSLIHI